MKAQTIIKNMEVLRGAFNVVRLVDAKKMKVVSFSQDGALLEEPYQCFSVWNKTGRCENCISAKAYASQGDLTKFEFLDDMICFVIAKYTEVNGAPYILEMVKYVDDKTLVGAYGKSAFIHEITSYNAKIYTDSLTGCYNRRYFDEQLAGLRHITAIATMDVDNFKTVNDRFGHEGGDAALKALAKILISHVRATDSVIRIGGDEFVIAFQEMHKEDLYAKLETIRKEVEAIRIPEYPDLSFTISFGGFYSGEYCDDLFKLSDERLYEAKKTKNTVVVG